MYNLVCTSKLVIHLIPNKVVYVLPRFLFVNNLVAETLGRFDWFESLPDNLIFCTRLESSF